MHHFSLSVRGCWHWLLVEVWYRGHVPSFAKMRMAGAKLHLPVNEDFETFSNAVLPKLVFLFSLAITDLLSDDYSSGISLKCKKSAGPVDVTIETERGSGGALSSKVGTKFACGGVKFDKVQLKADGGQVLESSLSPCSHVLLTFKGNKGADLGLEYVKGSLAATGTLDVKDMSKFSTSACVGVGSGVLLGADAAYSMSGKATALSGYNVGASYTKGPLSVSVTTASKISQLNVGTLYKVNDSLTLASSTSHTSAKPIGSFTVGGAYKASFGTVKAKISAGGNIDACVVKEVAPKVDVKATGSISSFDPSTFKYGLGIVM